MQLPSGLVYTDDSDPGFSRRRAGRGFAYYTPDGKLLADGDDKDRLKSLALPPAYKDVWYCSDPQGHLQATGRDDRDRKQYRYHAEWTKWRDAQKFSSLIDFGRVLPKLRNAMDYALQKDDLAKEKVVAALIKLLDKTAARIGNEVYYQENGTSGLTTLRERHADTKDNHLQLEYTAKGSEKREFNIYHPRLSTIVDQLHDLPGQRLFQYRSGDDVHPVTSTQVNDWLREKSGLELSAKDFRTWRASQLTLDTLLSEPAAASKSARKRQQTAALKSTSAALGHRPPVCRQHYVHPEILSRHDQDTLHSLFENVSTEQINGLSAAEAQLLHFLNAI